jgi:thiol:disulfide interchange protein DsbA
MMTKNHILASVFFFCTLSVNAQSKWEEGTHYKVVAQEKSTKPMVKEVFSYWCPACFRFESVAMQLGKALPDNVNFLKAHINFLGSASKEAQNHATLAMLAAKAMKDSAKFNQALFEAIHVKRSNIEDLDDIANVYGSAGGDAEKLRKLSNSFGIKSQFAKNSKATAGIRSVPTFIVNEKYQAIFTRDMTPDTYVNLILWLLKQE